MAALGAIGEPHPETTVSLRFTPQQLAALRILALTPALFAILSWSGNRAVLHFSLPVVIAVVGLIACCVTDRLHVRAALRNVRPTALKSALVFLLSATLATVFVATEPADAAAHLCVTIFELIMGFLLWDAFSSRWAALRRPAMVALAIGILGQVIVGYGLALWARDLPHFNWINFQAGTTHIRQIGFYGTSLCCLSAGLLANSETRFGRLGFFVLLTLGFAWNDLSGGRAAFAAGIGGVALVCALAPKGKRRTLGMLATCAFLLAMPLSLLYVPHPAWGLKTILGRLFGFHTIAEFTSDRIVLWIGAFKGFLASPLIGHGEHQFAYEVAHGAWNHPHNSILQYLYQWGIIGTGCVLIITAPILARIRKSVRAAPEVALPAAGAVVGLLLMSLLEGSLYHVFPVTVVVICLAVLGSVRTEA